MTLIGANELKRKMLIAVEGEPYSVMEVVFASPSARGASTLVRTKLRHLISGAVSEKTFKTSEKFAEPDVVVTPASFLYADRDGYHFMDAATYDQVAVNRRMVADALPFLKEGNQVNLLKYDDSVIGVELPITVELAVAQTDPGLRGDTVSGATKPARLETGASVNVPLFVNTGDVLKIDTRTGNYIERV